MKNALYSFLLLVPMIALSLTSCKKDSDLANAATGLAGRWQLTSRQCFCASTPLPNESIVFNDATASFYKDGQLIGSYTYAITTGFLCGTASQTAGITLLPTGISHGNPSFAGFTVSATSLTLDYGSPCDAPRDTYQRQP